MMGFERAVKYEKQCLGLKFCKKNTTNFIFEANLRSGRLQEFKTLLNAVYL